MSKRIGAKSFSGKALSQSQVAARTSSESVETARKNYLMWHQKEVEAFRVAAFSFPKNLELLGVATDILYFSDKWETDGDGYRYEHDFSSLPEIYGCPKAFSPRPKSNGTFEMGEVLACDPEGSIPLAFMAFVHTLKFFDGKKHLEMSREELTAPAWCLPDRLGILVLIGNKSEDCLVIRGGNMIITDRGIVN